MKRGAKSGKRGVATPRPACGHLLPGRGGEGAEVEAALVATEVARLLGFSAVTVRVWAACGRIRGRRIGGRWRFFWSEVRASLSGQSEFQNNKQQENS